MQRSRVLGWAPLVLLVVTAGGTGALGAVQASQAVVPTVASVLSATAAPGTARYVATSVSSSPNPFLRSRSATTAAVNFRNGDSSAVTVTHSLSYGRSNGGPWQIRHDSITWVQRMVNGQTYVHLGPSWTKTRPFPGQVSMGVINGFGPNDIGLLALPAAELHLVPLGSASVGGVRVTGYRVEPNRRLNICTTNVQFSSNGQPIQTEIWVDAQNRLRAIRTTVSYKLPPAGVPALPGPAGRLLTGVVSTATYLRITNLGVPVRITVPPLSRDGVSSSIILEHGQRCPNRS